jgi:hypothetical protein
MGPNTIRYLVKSMEACELEYTSGTARRKNYRIRQLATRSGSLLRTAPRADVSAKNSPRVLTRLERGTRLVSRDDRDLSLSS